MVILGVCLLILFFFFLTTCRNTMPKNSQKFNYMKETDPHMPWILYSTESSAAELDCIHVQVQPILTYTDSSWMANWVWDVGNR